MITASTLQTLTSFTTRGLAIALKDSGYTGAHFLTATFVGITNSGEFCYSVSYPDESGTGEAVGKVFLKYDSAGGKVTAEY